MQNLKQLSKRINAFIVKYAGIRPDWDGESEDGKFTSPDAYELRYCAEMLEQGQIPSRCFSEWGSGGFRPYASREGRQEHDEIVKEIYVIIRSKEKR